MGLDQFVLADRLYKSPVACKANLSLEACREIVADLLDALDEHAESGSRPESGPS